MSKDCVVSARAKRLVLDSSGFNIEHVAQPSLQRPFKILNYQSTRALDEEWHDVTLGCMSTDNSAIRAIEYRTAKGQVGFNDVGQPLLVYFLDALLADAWTWSHEEQRYVRYADVKGKLERPSQFLWLSWASTNPPQPHTALCYHAPTDELQDGLESTRGQHSSSDRLQKPVIEAILANDVRGLQKLQLLLQISEACTFVSAWAADFRRPRTISANDLSVGDRLKRICEHDLLTLELVESEDLLPVA